MTFDPTTLQLQLDLVALLLLFSAPLAADAFAVLPFVALRGEP